MKNRILESEKKNGKFFCWHKWEVDEPVGPDWDITLGLKILCRCTKCGRRSRVYSMYIEEVPDHLVQANIVYRP